MEIASRVVKSSFKTGRRVQSHFFGHASYQKVVSSDERKSAQTWVQGQKPITVHRDESSSESGNDGEDVFSLSPVYTSFVEDAREQRDLIESLQQEEEEVRVTFSELVDPKPSRCGTNCRVFFITLLSLFLEYVDSSFHETIVGCLFPIVVTRFWCVPKDAVALFLSQFGLLQFIAFVKCLFKKLRKIRKGSNKKVPFYLSSDYFWYTDSEGYRHPYYFEFGMFLFHVISFGVCIGSSYFFLIVKPFHHGNGTQCP